MSFHGHRQVELVSKVHVSPRLLLLSKQQKKLDCIRASRMKEYQQAMAAGKSFPADAAAFGEEGLTVRVNMRGEESLPYMVGRFTFAAGAGLYGIVRLAEDAAASRLERLLMMLGFSGIGGQRTSGCGKFTLLDGLQRLTTDAGSADARALAGMLDDEGAAWQMAVSLLLPGQEDIAAVKDGQYLLQKRSGFISLPADGMAQKKDSLYMLAAGSCLKKRIAGEFVSCSRGAGHEVWRCGRGMYVGLA